MTEFYALLALLGKKMSSDEWASSFPWIFFSVKELVQKCAINRKYCQPAQSSCFKLSDYIEMVVEHQYRGWDSWELTKVSFELKKTS